MHRGFSSLIALLGLLALFLLASGGYSYLTTHSALPSALLSTNDTASSTVKTQSAEGTIVLEKKGTLLLLYKGIQLSPIETTKSVAEGLCGLVFGFTCVWDGKNISEKPYYVNGTSAMQPLITVSEPYPKTVVQYGPSMLIKFSDPGPAGPHRVYLVHRNLLGEIDAVHEAHIVSETGTNPTTLVWNGNESIVDEHGASQVRKLEKGHYELVVANTDTGVEGGVPSWIHLIDSAADTDKVTGSFIKPYAANTPLVNSYWDGRGVFFDGKENVDTVGLTFKRSEIAVFRGTDMPAENQLNTLVFYRRPDNAVIVTTNVEIFTFADKTLTLAELLAEIASGK